MIKAGKNKGTGLHKILGKIHIYGGLYCSFYLIMMGFTGFMFNHEKLLTPKENKVHWSEAVSLPEDVLADSLIDPIVEQINIFGHRPYWEQWTDDEGQFHFKIMRPGRQYSLILNKFRDSIFVEEVRPGFFLMMKGLHPSSTGMPEHPVFSFWRIYAESSAIITMIVIFISVYFWFRKSVKNITDWIFITLSALFSLTFILYIWLIG